MRLALRLTSPQQFLSEHEFDERGGVIGRSSECDWVLECPHKLISRRHAVVAFEQNRFWLYDASANGVFHNQSTDPIGTGWRVPVEDGDSFRMGDFVIQAALIDASLAPATDHSPRQLIEPVPPLRAEQPMPAADRFAEPVISPVDVRVPERPAPAISVPHITFFDTQDSFKPPQATIPEDWDLALDLDLGRQREAPTATVSRRLSGLGSAAAEALWEGLLPEAGDDFHAELSPEVAKALGRCLRVSIEGLLSLRAEFAAVERNLTGGKRSPEDLAAPLGENVDAAAFCRQLVSDPFREERVSALEQAIGGMRGRHSDVVDGFGRSVETIIDQFVPEKFEERWEKHKAAETGKAPVSRVKDKLVRNAGFHSFYKAWHEEQQNAGYRAVHQLFEKKFLSIYAHRQKGKPERAPDETRYNEEQ